MRSTVVTLAAAAAALLLVAAPAAGAQEPPSRIQLCAATDIAAVDDLLSQVSTEDLVTRLQPLVSLTVPRDPDGVVLRESVDLTEVREALGCDAATPTPTPAAPSTPTVPVSPTGEPSQTPTPTFDVPSTGPGFSQVDDIPSAAAETGGGPA